MSLLNVQKTFELEWTRLDEGSNKKLASSTLAL